MHLSDAEWKVMSRLWQSAPATARDVLEALHAETGWAYTTVKTVMDRLVEKGALAAKKRANTTWYEPRVTQKEVRKSAVRSLIDKAFDGAFAPLMSFLVEDERLSPADRKKIVEMLRQSRARKAPR
jgi:BlaI family penicillinase repressor